MNNLDRISINTHILCDYIPVVSTFSNLYVLFQKYVLKDIPNNEMPDRYYQYLQDKSIYRCVVLLVPVIGNIFIALHDYMTSYNPIYENGQVAPLELNLEQAAAPNAKAEDADAGDSALRFAGPHVRDDQATVLLAIEGNPKAIVYASDRLKNLVPVVDAAVQKDGLLLRFAGPDPRNNEETVLLAIRQNPNALEFVSDELKNLLVNHEHQAPIVDEAVQQDGLTLRFAGDYVRDNEYAVWIAIGQNPAAIEFASDRLKNLGHNMVPVLDTAVERDGLLLRFGGPLAKDNEATVELALRQNPLAIQYASERLRNVPRFYNQAARDVEAALRPAHA